MTPPAQPFNPQPNNHRHDSNRGGKSTHGQGCGRGRAQGPPDQPKKFFYHFHGVESDHTMNHCLEKKKTLNRMEAEKKAKLVGHTSWIGSSQTHNPQQPQHYNLIPPSHAYNPTPQTLPSAPPFNPFQPLPAFSYNPYPTNWQPPQPNSQRVPSQPPNSNPQESLPLEAPSPTRIKCERLRRALLPLGTGQLLSVHTVDRQLPRRLVSYQGKH